MRSIRRITVLQRHLSHAVTPVNSSNTDTPVLIVQPTTCMLDDKIHIRVHGLAANQIVTLTSLVEEGGTKWEARAVFKANSDGEIDNRRDPSIAGDFTGIEPMGLFWSIKQAPGQRSGLTLTKKDVCTPLTSLISLYGGSHADAKETQQSPMRTVAVHRLYKAPHVRRMPIREGPYIGTVFLPEGDGPFPAVVDTYGAVVSLIESRASLLASHGYAVFALCYLYKDHLPKASQAANPNYFMNAIDWFSQQDYVDEQRLGAVGHCLGGMLSLMCAAMSPKLRYVVAINAVTVVPRGLPDVFKAGRSYVPRRDHLGNTWPNPDRIYSTKEGIVIKDAYDNGHLMYIPSWRHGANVLLIVGEDDLQFDPSLTVKYVNHWPLEYRRNVELVRYPGTGHVIDPPYTPLGRVASVGRSRLESTVEFLKEEVRGTLFMAGGFPKQHANAQEDAWKRTLEFLQKHV